MDSLYRALYIIQARVQPLHERVWKREFRGSKMPELSPDFYCFRYLCEGSSLKIFKFKILGTLPFYFAYLLIFFTKVFLTINVEFQVMQIQSTPDITQTLANSNLSLTRINIHFP